MCTVTAAPSCAITALLSMLVPDYDAPWLRGPPLGLPGGQYMEQTAPGLLWRRGVALRRGYEDGTVAAPFRPSAILLITWLTYSINP